MNPEVLLIASKGGASVIEEHVLSNVDWIHDSVGSGPTKTKVSYTWLSNGMEIFSIPKQIFGPAVHPGYGLIVETMEQLRLDWKSR
jgi:hypothetical protein